MSARPGPVAHLTAASVGNGDVQGHSTGHAAGRGLQGFRQRKRGTANHWTVLGLGAQHQLYHLLAQLHQTRLRPLNREQLSLAYLCERERSDTLPGAIFLVDFALDRKSFHALGRL
jgi:hypothetical protein